MNVLAQGGGASVFMVCRGLYEDVRTVVRVVDLQTGKASREQYPDDLYASGQWHEVLPGTLTQSNLDSLSELSGYAV